MSDFSFYFRIGWQHIIGRDALDHQLFILALAAIYVIKEWKQVLILYCFYYWSPVTLFLSVKDITSTAIGWNFLMCTIFYSLPICFGKVHTKTIRINYFLALFLDYTWLRICKHH
jgi:hypothetical protein